MARQPVNLLKTDLSEVGWLRTVGTGLLLTICLFLTCVISTVGTVAVLAFVALPAALSWWLLWHRAGVARAARQPVVQPCLEIVHQGVPVCRIGDDSLQMVNLYYGWSGQPRPLHGPIPDGARGDARLVGYGQHLATSHHGRQVMEQVTWPAAERTVPAGQELSFALRTGITGDPPHVPTMEEMLHERAEYNQRLIDYYEGDHHHELLDDDGGAPPPTAGPPPVTETVIVDEAMLQRHYVTEPVMDDAVMREHAAAVAAAAARPVAFWITIVAGRIKDALLLMLACQMFAILVLLAWRHSALLGAAVAAYFVYRVIGSELGHAPPTSAELRRLARKWLTRAGRHDGYCLEVRRNGRRICTLGSPDFASVGVNLGWMRPRDGAPLVYSNQVYINPVAQTKSGDQAAYHKGDGHPYTLRPGDTMTFKIVRGARVDAPSAIYENAAGYENLRRMERQQYRALRAEQ